MRSKICRDRGRITKITNFERYWVPLIIFDRCQIIDHSFLQWHLDFWQIIYQEEGGSICDCD